MKLVTAIIRSHQVPAVRNALYDRQISKISISTILGTVQQKDQYDFSSRDDSEVDELHYRGAVRKVYARQRVRLEVVVQEDFVETAIEAIVSAARTGELGDGIIYVVDVHEFVNIRTGERGPSGVK